MATGYCAPSNPPYSRISFQGNSNAHQLKATLRYRKHFLFFSISFTRGRNVVHLDRTLATVVAVIVQMYFRISTVVYSPCIQNVKFGTLPSLYNVCRSKQGDLATAIATTRKTLLENRCLRNRNYSILFTFCDVREICCNRIEVRTAELNAENLRFTFVFMRCHVVVLLSFLSACRK